MSIIMLAVNVQRSLRKCVKTDKWTQLNTSYNNTILHSRYLHIILLKYKNPVLQFCIDEHLPVKCFIICRHQFVQLCVVEQE